MSLLADHGAELVLLGVAAVCVLLARLVPRTAVLLWAAVLVFVPYWVALETALVIPVSVLASAGLVVVTIRRGLLPRPMDWVLAGFLLLLVVSVVLGVGRTDEVITFLVGPLVAYATGRTVSRAVPLQWVYKVLGTFFVALAVLVILESWTGENLFIATGPETVLSGTWAEQRVRGELIRAEASFGQSIALGASVAMTLPLVWAARWPVWWRAIAISLLATAAFLTISRIAIMSTLLALLAMAVLSRHRLTWRQAGLTLIVALPALAIGIYAFRRTFQAAGAEATKSAAYRADLQGLIPSMEWLGISKSLFISAEGVRYFGQFRSIDSQMILGGLLYGVVPLALLFAPILVGLIMVLARHASAPLIAVVCQLPALFNVALITQYGIYFWFLVGLAATVTTARSESALDRSASEDLIRPGPTAGIDEFLLSSGISAPPRSLPTRFV